MPRLSSGVDYAPVVNNSRIEWTKLHQFATLWLAPTSIGLTVLSQDFCFTSKVHFTNFESQIFDVIRILILCSFVCAFRRRLTINNGVIIFFNRAPSIMDYAPFFNTVDSPNKGHFGTNINSSGLSTV